MNTPDPRSATPAPEEVQRAELARAADEAYQARADLDRQDLLTIKHAPALIEQLRGLAGPDESICGRVRFGAEMALVALCERIGRACRRDQPVPGA